LPGATPWRLRSRKRGTWTRVAKGITQYGAADLERIQGRQSHAIAEVLDEAPADYVVHRDDLVVEA
jgi:Glutamate 5-kinase